jgi:hypothetical protein
MSSDRTPRVVRNPFRNRDMRRAFDECVVGYEKRHKNFFTHGGLRHRANSIADYFWRGYDGVNAQAFADAGSRQTLAYAYWRAGRACAEAETDAST